MSQIGDFIGVSPGAFVEAASRGGVDGEG